MVKNQSLVSVIVPIYKVEDKLKRCIESILNQTYDNLEVILVDDGSPDRCPEIYSEYAPYTYVDELKSFVQKVMELKVA